MAVNSARPEERPQTEHDAHRFAVPHALVASVALFIGAAAQAGPCTSLEPARWLLGSWVADGGKRIVTETWTEASPTTFEGQGVTRDRTDGPVVDGEELRLVAMGDGVFYVAKVAHNDYPVAFRLTTCEADRLVFENPAHDFPRRLEYQRVDDGRLEVHVSDGAERGFTLDFRRSPAP
jgi:hypothetical protein